MYAIFKMTNRRIKIDLDSYPDVTIEEAKKFDDVIVYLVSVVTSKGVWSDSFDSYAVAKGSVEEFSANGVAVEFIRLATVDDSFDPDVVDEEDAMAHIDENDPNGGFFSAGDDDEFLTSTFGQLD